MTDPDYGLAVPISIRYHQKAFDQILNSIKEGTYCALLGPRLCGKSVLLRYLEHTLDEFGWPCLYIDLQTITAATLQGFFADLMAQASKNLHHPRGDRLNYASHRGRDFSGLSGISPRQPRCAEEGPGSNPRQPGRNTHRPGPGLTDLIAGGLYGSAIHELPTHGRRIRCAQPGDADCG